MFATESTLVGMAAFLLAWGILNFLWLALLRRPAAAGVLSLTLLTVLVLLSDLKHHVLKMTASFIDLMIIDTDTVTFLFTIFPALRWIALLSAAVLVPIVLLCWRHDPLRVRRLAAIALAGGCVGGLAEPRDMVSGTRVRSLLRQQRGFVLRAHRRRRHFRAADARLPGIGRRLRRSAEIGGGYALPAPGQAAAHHFDSR